MAVKKLTEQDKPMTTDEKLVNFYKAIEPFVVTFYAGHRDIFKTVSWDYKDLKQEVLITIWERIVKMTKDGKTDIEQIKYCKKSIKNVLLHFLRKAQVKKLIKLDSTPLQESSFTVDIINKEFVFDSIKHLLTDTEYKVIYALYHDDMAINVDTARLMGFKSKSTLQYHADSALEKLRKIDDLCTNQNNTYGKK
jgi:DNA-directed RNA polymerase specialized sigma24 family protein